MFANREKFQRKVGFLGRIYVNARGDAIKAHNLAEQLKVEKRQQQLNDIVNNACKYVYFNYDAEAREIRAKWNAERQKQKRARTRLKWMFDAYDELHFLTLTFTDEVLQSTNERTRHRHVQTWLNNNCKDYMANIDYGKTNGREHYHAVVSFKDKVEKWPDGFSNDKVVRRSGNQEKRSLYHIAGYLVKLANHSAKDGTGRTFSKIGWKEVDNIPF